MEGPLRYVLSPPDAPPGQRRLQNRPSMFSYIQTPALDVELHRPCADYQGLVLGLTTGIDGALLGEPHLRLGFPHRVSNVLHLLRCGLNPDQVQINSDFHAYGLSPVPCEVRLR